MDYDKLIERLRRRGLSNGSALGPHSGLYEEAATAIETLRTDLARVTAERDAAKSADVAPVVHCRECKHFNLVTHECENECLSTDHEGGASYSLNFYDDDFCSYGERKED